MSLRTRLLIWFVAVSMLASSIAAITIAFGLARRMSSDLSALGRDAAAALAAQAGAALEHTVSEFVSVLDPDRTTLPVDELLRQMVPAHAEVTCAAFLPSAPAAAIAAAGTCSADLPARVRAAHFRPAGAMEVAAGIPGSHGYQVPVRVPLAPASARAGGMLLLLVDMEQVLHTRRLFNHANTFASQALILDEHGIVLAHSGAGFRPQPGEMADVPVHLLDGRPFRMADLLHLGVTEGKFARNGALQVFTAESVPDLSWVVLISTPLSTITDLLGASFGFVIPTLALTLGISFLVWWLVAHNLTRGLAAMARTADRLAEDLSTPVPVPPSAELAMVAQALERMRQGLAGYRFAMLRTLMNALEARDEYTRGHSERVTLYAEAIGHHLGLSAADMQTLQVGAILHDVGKLGLDAAVLRKPGRLTAAEWREVQRHPVIGEQILQPLEPLHHVLPIVRSHHERLDGTGYPDGLSGEQIPLLVRIVAVADCYDAMTSHRPYRLALSRERAVAELRDMAGRHLDRTVVQALVQALASMPDLPAAEPAAPMAANLP